MNGSMSSREKTPLAICRLARFNIEQAGTAKTHFHGLPSPTAGITLATYYSFTQTPFFQTYFARGSVPRLAEWMMIVLAVLMVSSVIYPVVPRVGLRTWGGRVAMALTIVLLLVALMWPEYTFFPAAVAYIAWGVLRTVMSPPCARARSRLIARPSPVPRVPPAVAPRAR